MAAAQEGEGGKERSPVVVRVVWLNYWQMCGQIVVAFVRIAYNVVLSLCRKIYLLSSVTNRKLLYKAKQGKVVKKRVKAEASIPNYGLFVPKTFRSLERMFHTGTFVP